MLCLLSGVVAELIGYNTSQCVCSHWLACAARLPSVTALAKPTAAIRKGFYFCGVLEHITAEGAGQSHTATHVHPV